MTSLKASFRACRRATRSAGSNFYLPLLLLPPDKRAAMYSLYAFFRHVDDIADSEQHVEARRRSLQGCHAAIDERTDDLVIFPALWNTVERFDINVDYLHQVVCGVERDLVTQRYETFEQLHDYCRLVATAVGLVCLPVWGFRSKDVTADMPEVAAAADACGVAFQLTNILRDIPEDARRSRIYLPQQELRMFSVSERDIAEGRFQGPMIDLMRFQLLRAERYFREAAALDELLSGDGRRIYRAMMRTYLLLFQQIVRRNGDVFSTRVTLSRMQRLGCALGACLGSLPRSAQ